MKNFFRSTKFRICTAILTAMLLAVFISAVSENGSSPVSSALSYILTPIENIAVHISESLSEFNGYFVSSKAMEKYAEELQSEIYDLRLQLVDYEKTRHKLEAYEDFLGVREKNPDFRFASGEIILRDTSDFYGSFTLNIGSDDGISVNDPVIYSDNLVGVVATVSPKNCTVHTLYNPEISVSAYEIRTREACFTESEYALTGEGFLKLSGLKKNTPVVSGGVVCTSGIGGIYPKDLIIGTVREIKNDITGLSSYGLVAPGIDYSKLTDVFVITDFEGKSDG